MPERRGTNILVQQGRQDQLIQIVQSILPGSKRIEILTEVDSPILHVVYPDRSVPVEFAGDGVHALLRMSMEIARRAGTTVLIEEPELHQHPGAVAQSARVIVAATRGGIQVVLSTHSLELIDSILAASDEKDLERLCVFRLKLDDGGLVSHRLAGKEVAFARKEIEDDLR
jgi:predicted ATPase